MFDRPSPCDLDPDDYVEALIEEDRRKADLQRLAEYTLFQREAKRLADAMERADDRKPVWRTLREQLQRPLNEEKFSIDRLLPLGGNALFAGRYKAGKTTFNGQLLKAWADGTPFLGNFQVHPDPQRPNVTIFNYEMSEDQMQRWLIKVGIENQDAVNVVHLRGLTVPLGLAEVRAELAMRLADAGTGLWVVDPASRAFAGAGDVNSNSDVATWLGQLDEVKMNAGIRDLVLNIHMGHAAGTGDAAAERAIGAQAWSAWADALWFLNFEAQKRGATTPPNRQFWASGRDVEVEKQYVHYDPESMAVMLLDNPPIPPNSEEAKEHGIRKLIVECVQNNDAISESRLIRMVRDMGGKGKSDDVKLIIQDLAQEGYLKIEYGGRGKPNTHHIAEDRPYLTPPNPT